MNRLVACLLVAAAPAMIHGADHSVTWQIAVSPTSLTAAAGDTVTFTWTGTHNVYKFSSKTAYDNCDFTAATQITGGNASPVTTQVSSDVLADGKAYYACQVSGHCSSGQKLTVTVSASTGTTCTTPGSSTSCPNANNQVAANAAVATACASGVCTTQCATECAKGEKCGCYQPPNLPAANLVCMISQEPACVSSYALCSACGTTNSANYKCPSDLSTQCAATGGTGGLLGGLLGGGITTGSTTGAAGTTTPSVLALVSAIAAAAWFTQQ